MKTAVMAAAFLGFITVCCAQDIPETNVPSVALNAFKSAFPQARDTEWEMKGDVYNVEFEIDRTDHEVWMDRNGKIIRHETDIRAADVPANIRTAVLERHKNMTIDDAEKIEKDGKTYYKIELDGKTGDMDVFTDDKGNELTNPSFLY